ncbi:hypothetical protein E2K67_06235, partial [Escherichia coli]
MAEGVALLRPTYFYAAVPMDVSYLLDSLNDKQREAVAAPRSMAIALFASTMVLLFLPKLLSILLIWC